MGHTPNNIIGTPNTWPFGDHQLQRHRERGSVDRALLDALLDDVHTCVVSSVAEGMPWAVPTFCARREDELLIHGSTGAGLLRHIAAGAPAVVTVMTLDALTFAETLFDSSANYRSATIRGCFAPVPDEDQEAALVHLTDVIMPGRCQELPRSTSRDLKATMVLALPILDGAWMYKERSGGVGPLSEPCVIDGKPVWRGVLPVRTAYGQPQPAPEVPTGTELPHAIRHLIQSNVNKGN